MYIIALFSNTFDLKIHENRVFIDIYVVKQYPCGTNPPPVSLIKCAPDFLVILKHKFHNYMKIAAKCSLY